MKRKRSILRTNNWVPDLRPNMLTLKYHTMHTHMHIQSILSTQLHMFECSDQKEKHGPGWTSMTNVPLT